jgi:phosphoribosylanthranilate isomerase
VEGVHCGYAGGIGPENVIEILKKIGDVAGETPFWIDMESRVRDDQDRFDITKAESVLDQVHTYLA